METKRQPLKDALAAANLPAEPDLERALFSIFGDPRVIVNAKDERQKTYAEVPGLKSKLEKLEYRQSRTDPTAPEMENIRGRIAAIKNSLTKLAQNHPELAIKTTEVYTAAANEWIAWAREVSVKYRTLGDHPECYFEDSRVFERIAKRYDDDIEDVQKLCKSVERQKTAYVTSAKSHRNDYRQMLEEFVLNVTNFLEEYQRQHENIKKELAEIVTRHAQPALTVQHKRRKRNR